MPITLHSMRPFTARPVILAASDEKRATFRSATCNYQYIVRALAGQDVCGMTPDFSTRLDELIMSGRAAPRRADTGTLVGQRLWQAADRSALAHRLDRPVAWHCVGSLPTGLQLPDWRMIIDEFLEDHMVRQGMIIDWAIHHREETEELPGILPHVHFLVTARGWDPKRKPGAVMQNWLATHASRRRHAERWYVLTEMFPAPGYELRAEAA